MPFRDEKNARPAHHASHAAPAGRPTARRARRQGQGPGLASDSEQISTIRAGQGARVTTRANAAEAAGRARKSAERRYAERHPEARAPQAGPRRSALNVVLLVVAAILALAVIFVLGTLVTSWLFPTPQEEPAAQEQTLRPTEEELQVQQQQEEHDAGQEQVGTDGSVSYGGETYALRQADDGSWGLVNAAGDVLLQLEGTPFGLVRSADTLLVPESRDGGWDVVSYVVGGHLDGITYVMGPDGNPVGGSGDITAVELDGTTLRVTAGGATTDVALA
ncbi:hypothetical protein H6A07_09360 [Olsenella uli]|uniref:hypothetical protein n=1 Tax=Olsenella uli TaxID=133926 RepID=UPI001958D938|nr:hypothetical protein [Olsenella uli]MBM6676940.1 hypothetical protein [Olsenella uli]